MLYRAKRINDGEWVKGDKIVSPYLGMCIYNRQVGRFDSVIPITLAMQTGIKDKNSVDLWGSILVDGEMSNGGDMVKLAVHLDAELSGNGMDERIVRIIYRHNVNSRWSNKLIMQFCLEDDAQFDHIKNNTSHVYKYVDRPSYDNHDIARFLSQCEPWEIVSLGPACDYKENNHE